MRGEIYGVEGQGASTVGLLVLSGEASFHFGKEVTGLPVKRVDSEFALEVGAGFVTTGNLIRVPAPRLVDPVARLEETELDLVSQEVADNLLIPELCASPPRFSETNSTDGVLRWGRTYYAAPPLGGETKRWLVVSHNYFNRATKGAICVRTTSNTELSGPDIASIQRGFARAVCADLITTPPDRFDLESGANIEQVKPAEMVAVARALTNFLGLLAQAGY